MDSEILKNINLKDFPEHKPRNRIKLSYKWIDANVENLLDGGCSFGYGTKLLAERSKNTFGIDVNMVHIAVASMRYKNINFKSGVLEHTDYRSEFFDLVNLNDVLEHTNDKIQTLNEMYRVLKKGGKIIITTPHKGLFAFLDPYNYGYYLRRLLPGFYKLIYKLIRFVKEGKIPEEFNPEHTQKHEHYSLKDFKAMLNQSSFHDGYKIEKVFRSGLIIEVMIMNIESILNIFLPQRVSRIILKPLSWLGDVDYWIPYGVFSYNIAIKVSKL